MDNAPVKTFEASNLAEALKVIKKELGPDAIVLETREKRSRFGLLNKASVEVKATVNTNQKSRSSSKAKFGSEIHLEDVISWGLTKLIRSGISEGHTRNVAQAMVDEIKRLELKSVSREEILWHLKNQMKLKIKTAPSLIERSFQGDLPKVLALVGPTGVGKTTTLAKMASLLKKDVKKRIILATSDTFKISAIEHLRTYAKMLHLPFAVCRDLGELKSLIVQSSRDDFILLDTLGIGPEDRDKMSELSLILNNLPIESHLCLSATTKGEDLDYIVEQFRVYRPRHVIFTKLDESSRLGELYNVMVNSKIPASFLTFGQRVPADISVADKEDLLNKILSK